VKIKKMKVDQPRKPNNINKGNFENGAKPHVVKTYPLAVVAIL